jgi:hypothetical protein
MQTINTMGHQATAMRALTESKMFILTLIKTVRIE